MKNHLPVLELIDRLCIARLKWRKIQQNQEELEWYEQEWNEAMWKLANSRHRLTVEDENAIKKIANKL